MSTISIAVTFTITLDSLTCLMHATLVLIANYQLCAEFEAKTAAQRCPFQLGFSRGKIELLTFFRRVIEYKLNRPLRLQRVLWDTSPSLQYYALLASRIGNQFA
jgi:hypothetical protein